MEGIHNRVSRFNDRLLDRVRLVMFSMPIIQSIFHIGQFDTVEILPDRSGDVLYLKETFNFEVGRERSRFDNSSFYISGIFVCHDFSMGEMGCNDI